LCVASGCMAKFFAKKKRTIRNKEFTSCCDTGCCSAYALKAWGLNSYLAILFLLVASITMYTAMDAVAQNLVTLIDDILELSVLGGPAGDALSGIDSQLSLIEPLKPAVSLLGIAVLVPALLNIACMFISGSCAMRASSTMCCAKCFAFLGMALSVLSIIVYIIFAAIGFVVTMPMTQEVLVQVTGICKSAIPQLEELKNGAVAATTNIPASELDQSLTDNIDLLQQGFAIMDSSCNALDDLIFNFAGLLVPGFVCTVASFYALISQCSLCCSAKCCKSPEVTGKVAPA